MLRTSEGGARPLVGAAFLSGLLALPLAKRLTHLASNWPFDDSQAEAIRAAGVEPAHATHGLWMHDLSPSCFCSPGRVPGAG